MGRYLVLSFCRFVVLWRPVKIEKRTIRKSGKPVGQACRHDWADWACALCNTKKSSRECIGLASIEKWEPKDCVPWEGDREWTLSRRGYYAFSRHIPCNPLASCSILCRASHFILLIRSNYSLIPHRPCILPQEILEKDFISTTSSSGIHEDPLIQGREALKVKITYPSHTCHTLHLPRKWVGR